MYHLTSKVDKLRILLLELLGEPLGPLGGNLLNGNNTCPGEVPVLCSQAGSLL
jgi:hypothetical protein